MVQDAGSNAGDAGSAAERGRPDADAEYHPAEEREDWYMFADQALLLGVVDEVITPENELNEII